MNGHNVVNRVNIRPNLATALIVNFSFFTVFSAKWAGKQHQEGGWAVRPMVFSTTTTALG